MRLYVGNLSPDTTPEELREAFQAHGEVDSVSLPAEQMKQGAPVGAHRGYGFVVMTDRKAAAAAIAALNGKTIHGQAVSVRVAIPKWTPQYIR